MFLTIFHRFPWFLTVSVCLEKPENSPSLRTRLRGTPHRVRLTHLTAEYSPKGCRGTGLILRQIRSVGVHQRKINIRAKAR